MGMDWPSTFRADLSIQTYQDLANVHPFSLTGMPKLFPLRSTLTSKAWERTPHATIPMTHIRHMVNTFGAEPALRNFQSNDRRWK
jgi:hypothetical protein